MKIIKSLLEIGVDEKLFPIFFWQKWKIYEETINQKSKVLIYIDEVSSSVISIVITQLKILTKGQYLYTPLNFNGERLNSELERKVLNRFHHFLKQKKICDVIFPPNHHCVFQSVPNRCLYYELGLIVKDLTISEDKLFTSMKSNYRNEIRKIQERNINVIFEKDCFDEFYQLFKSIHLEQNLTPTPKEELLVLRNLFVNHTKIGVLKDETEPLSAVFTINDNHFGYYSYAGNCKNLKYSGANKIILFEVFKIMRNEGVKKIILGGYRPFAVKGGKHDGIQKFKIRFGAEIEMGYHFIYIVNPLKYNFFTTMLKIKSKLVGRNMSILNLTGLELKKS